MSFPRSELAALWTLALVFSLVADRSAARHHRRLGADDHRIGAVVDQTGGSTSPHYRAAIELAGRQMNEALAQAASKVRFEISFGDSKSNPPFAQQEALRLINQHGVKALVGDSSGVSVALNRLNYDPGSQAKRKVAITCFQCSSSFINDPEVTQSDPQVQAAERDADGWLFRVFYVAKFEAGALAQIALKRANKGSGAAQGRHLRRRRTSRAGNRPRQGVALVPQGAAGGRHRLPVGARQDRCGMAAGDRRQGRGRQDRRSARCRDRRHAARPGGGGHQGLSRGRLSDRRSCPTTRSAATTSSKRSARSPTALEGSSVTQVDKGASGQAFVEAFKAAIGEIAGNDVVGRLRCGGDADARGADGRRATARSK